jgi:hypothetical protein
VSATDTDKTSDPKPKRGQRGDAPAVADDREPALAHGLDHPVIGRAVEPAVAKGDPTGVGNRLIEIPQRGGGLTHRRHRGRVERVVLGLDRPTHPGVPRAGEALGYEPLDAGAARRGQQRVGALGPKPVGLREDAVEVPGEMLIPQGGRLMDDRVRLGFENSLAHRARVEQIERDRLRAERAYAFRALTRRGGADHLVPAFDQLRNEPASYCAARPCDEDSHRSPFGTESKSDSRWASSDALLLRCCRSPSA